MFSAEPVCSCAFLLCAFARETAGAARTRLSLRPLISEGQCSGKLRAHRAARSRTHIRNQERRHCEERSDEAIHPSACAALWIASRSLSSGARSRDPVARNDGLKLFAEATSCARSCALPTFSLRFACGGEYPPRRRCA